MAEGQRQHRVFATVIGLLPVAIAESKIRGRLHRILDRRNVSDAEPGIPLPTCLLQLAVKDLRSCPHPSLSPSWRPLHLLLLYEPFADRRVEGGFENIYDR